MLFGRVEAETVALAIPILFVMGGILVAITAIVMQARRKDLEHRERIIAMEKGLPLPEPVVPVSRERPRYSSRRANGLVLIGIGISLTIAMWLDDPSTGPWGLIPLFIGIGLLIASHLDKKEWERERELENKRVPMA